MGRAGGQAGRGRRVCKKVGTKLCRYVHFNLIYSL